MIGILVITHGTMAEGIINSASMIMGENEQLQSLSLMPNADLEQFPEEVFNKIVSLDTGEGVIVFADLFGASPYNFTAVNMRRLMEEEHKVRLITGANLPMLIETLNARSYENDIGVLYKDVLEAGKEGIKELLEEMEDY